MSAVIDTAPCHDLHVSRRTYDRLEVARVLPGKWMAPAPESWHTACWPYLAVYLLAGTASIEHRGRSVHLTKGDFCMLSNTARLSIKSSAQSDLFAIFIPECSVGPYGQALDAADGRSWSAHDGTASLVAHLLEGLAAQFDDYAPANAGRLAHHIVGLMALMCSDDRSSAGAGPSSMLQRAKEYIEEWIEDIDLTPDRIAATQNISTRTLYRLFENEGRTISGWIRLRRLEHCRIDLADRGTDALSVSRIGAKWGLWDAAHFSRLFKANYGVSPRAYRSVHAGHSCDESCVLAAAELRIATV